MNLDFIENFKGQLKYKPEIENPEFFKKRDKFVVAGMGGSNLAGGFLKIWNPKLDLIIQKNYGLPEVSEEDLKNRLIICSSYSGNTEETINVFNLAVESKLPAAVISSGGRLLDLAKEFKIPYVQLPADIVNQPRLALVLSLKAMLKLIGDEPALKEIEKLADSFNAVNFESDSQNLAEKLKNKIPLIYSSARNKPLAYTWKVLINESSKIPAFFNVLSEANHNEMISFDITPISKPLSEKFHFVFLRDDADNEKIIKRMDLTKIMYQERGFGVETVDLKEESVWEKIFNSYLLVVLTANNLAGFYGTDPEQVQMVEEFKKLVS